MGLTRRQFLTLLGGSAAGAVVFQACGVPARELLVQSPFQMPEDLVSGFDNWYATLCRQCPTSEGVVVRVMEGRAKKVEGNVDYPLNRGAHSARCEAALQALYHPDRISGPLVRVGQRGGGRWEEISWPDAIGRLVFQLQQLQAANNQAAMVMVTEPLGGHLGMVVERFVSRFGGRYVPFETVERTNLRAAIKRVFNQDVMPDFDFENTRYLLSFGADFLSTWVSPTRYNRGYGRFRQGERERGTHVHVDSRFSMTAANADETVFVRPGWEGVLALSMAQVIVSEGLGDSAAASALTGGNTAALDAFAPQRVADRVGVAAERIRQVARDFARQRPSLAIGGGSAAAHTNGLFNLVAIYSLNYLVGSVGTPGGIIFNPRPAFPDVPVSPAGASFAQWQQLVQEMRAGRVQVLLVRGANPWYGLPEAAGFRDAMFNVPFIFTFSSILDDTTAMSDLVFPEHAALEDWGDDVPDPGPGYQLVGFQQPVVRPFFESRGTFLGTKSFPNVLLTVAQGMALDLGLPGQTFLDVLQDGARQLFQSNRGMVGNLRPAEYGSFEAFWNGLLQHGFWRDESARATGPAPTPPALPLQEQAPSMAGPTGERTFQLVPFEHNSLGDGRGAFLPWLQATPDPVTTNVWRTWVDINHHVAEEMDIREGDVVRIVSGFGPPIEALANPNPATPPDVVSVPLGQGHFSGGRYADGRGSNVLSILAPQVDTETGALAWAATRVRIEKLQRWVRLPKFENVVPEFPRDEEQLVIKLTPRDT